MLLFYTHWKHQKTFWFSVFKGYRKARSGCNGLNQITEAATWMFTELATLKIFSTYLNKTYNCSGHPAFKSQKVGYPLDNHKLSTITKNYCIITISIQKINPYIHARDTADFRVSWTKRLWSFLTTPPKNHWINFWFS